jgi:hypothetical protein
LGAVSYSGWVMSTRSWETVVFSYELVAHNKIFRYPTATMVSMRVALSTTLALVALTHGTAADEPKVSRRMKGIRDEKDGKRRELSHKSKKEQTCESKVQFQAWKPMSECCPCCDLGEICDSLLLGSEGIHGECHPGDDCYSTAFNYPRYHDCEAELNHIHWMFETDFCNYDTITGEVDEGGGGESYYECCDFGCDEPERRGLFEEEDHVHHRHLVETEDGGVTVHVETDNVERLDWLTQHVTAMKERMDVSGKVPRKWDPLFQAYFENVKDINFECDGGSDKHMRCTSTSMTQCGKDLIKAHASYHQEIATSLQENGSHKIAGGHAIPESCN